jgi:hypothetical protein
MDVKTTFLHGDLKEEIYMKQPERLITFLHGDLEEEIYMKQPKGFVVKGKKAAGL